MLTTTGGYFSLNGAIKISIVLKEFINAKEVTCFTISICRVTNCFLNYNINALELLKHPFLNFYSAD